METDVSILFPYYIVRFKHSACTLRRKKPEKFPYYIVRFKPEHRNEMYFYLEEFPYYIVRFKPKGKDIFQGDIWSFHTT